MSFGAPYIYLPLTPQHAKKSENARHQAYEGVSPREEDLQKVAWDRKGEGGIAV